jgi:hypothetical protein
MLCWVKKRNTNIEGAKRELKNKNKKLVMEKKQGQQHGTRREISGKGIVNIVYVILIL